MRLRKDRLEAFTDGVIAIIITIMVLEIKVPDGVTLNALGSRLPILLTYALSFINVGIYWNNHHHMLSVAKHINGLALWANLSLLFWLSLVPFVIRWIDEAGLQSLPVALYGVILFMSATSYFWLQNTLIRVNSHDSLLAQAIGRDLKGKLSLIGYGSAVVLSFFFIDGAILLYILVSAMWFIPDKRIEKQL